MCILKKLLCYTGKIILTEKLKKYMFYHYGKKNAKIILKKKNNKKIK